MASDKYLDRSALFDSIWWCFRSFNCHNCHLLIDLNVAKLGLKRQEKSVHDTRSTFRRFKSISQSQLLFLGHVLYSNQLSFGKEEERNGRKVGCRLRQLTGTRSVSDCIVQMKRLCVFTAFAHPSLFLSLQQIAFTNINRSKHIFSYCKVKVSCLALSTTAFTVQIKGALISHAAFQQLQLPKKFVNCKWAKLVRLPGKSWQSLEVSILAINENWDSFGWYLEKKETCQWKVGDHKDGKIGVSSW